MNFIQPSSISTCCIALSGVALGGPLDDRLAEAHMNFLEDRREVLSSLSDPFGIPSTAKIVIEDSNDAIREKASWKRNVIATVFWIGEKSAGDDQVSKESSAWDQNWMANYGGYDDPNERNGYLPKAFTPSLNPFYVALPYNDIGEDLEHRPEAAQVIPWFWESYQGEGISVCKGKWIAIHREGRICYAQWEDVGPSESDHFQYVFGKQNARVGNNQGAGLQISPAVRDFLQMGNGERVEWKFVEEYEVPEGPWKTSSGDDSLPFNEPDLPTR